MSAILTGLSIYPVKSARGLDCRQAVVGKRGLQHDRDWMVIDDRGRFVTQRVLGGMAKLTVRVAGDGMTIDYPGMPCLRVAPPMNGPVRAVEIWGEEVSARDAGDGAAQWLSRCFGQVLRLVWMPEETVRPVDEAYAGGSTVPVSFADGFPILLANLASLEALNRRLPAAIPMARFRPNLVVDGWPAFAEDGIRRIRCGAVELALVKPCTRCRIPSLDHMTGDAAVDPTPALKDFRYDSRLRGVTFGVNAIVTAGFGQTIEVGERVQEIG